MRRSFAAFVITATSYQVLAAIALWAAMQINQLIGNSNIFTGFLAALETLFGLLPIGIVFVDVLAVIVTYIAFARTHYLLDSGEYQQIKEYADPKPGRIIVKTGLLRQQVTIYSMINYERVVEVQGLFGSLLGFGTITLTPTDSSNKPPLVLSQIRNPKEYVIPIQDMLDVSGGAGAQTE